MILFDALAWLFIAKLAVMVFEDAAYAARGKQSPRVAARRAGHGGGGAVRSGSRVGSAVGGYVAGLIEDSATAARAARRRRVARKRGKRAVNNILVDHGDDGAFYAHCDTCGWQSRPCRIEGNAHTEGDHHARTEHGTPPVGDGDEHPPPVGGGRTKTRLTLIPGGATPGVAEAAPDPKEANHIGAVSSVVHDGPSPYTLPTHDTYGWTCRRCATNHTGYPTLAAARAVGDNHTCPTTTPATGKENSVNTEATGPEQIRAAFTTAISTATDQADELAGIAGVLTEVADRYESLQMAPSTVGHLREAADGFRLAQTSLTGAVENLQAALADFNARDGRVADTVGDTGGNVAAKEVLVS